MQHYLTCILEMHRAVIVILAIMSSIVATLLRTKYTIYNIYLDHASSFYTLCWEYIFCLIRSSNDRKMHCFHYYVMRWLVFFPCSLYVIQAIKSIFDFSCKCVQCNNVNCIIKCLHVHVHVYVQSLHVPTAPCIVLFS